MSTRGNNNNSGLSKSELEQKLQEATQKLADKEQKLQEAAQKLADKEQKLQEATQKLANKEQDLQAASDALAQAQESLRAANDSSAELRSNSESYRRQAETEIGDLRTRLAELQEFVDGLDIPKPVDKTLLSDKDREALEGYLDDADAVEEKIGALRRKASRRGRSLRLNGFGG